MGFFLKKWLGSMLSPLSLTLLCLIAGLLCCARGRRRAGISLIVAATALLLAASQNQLSIWLVAPLENQFISAPAFSPDAPLPAPWRDCEIVAVLGGGHASGKIQPATSRLSSSALARLVEAVRLGRGLPHATLLLCGPFDENKPERPSHAEVLRDAAVALGFPPARIHLLTAGRDTAGEIREITAWADGRQVALVTSAWHLPRAVAMARKCQLNVVPCPADYIYRPNAEEDGLDWSCGLDGLERTSRASREYLGLLWSRLRGQT